MKRVITSREFFPIMITGLSGNGKTLMVEQACAITKRTLVKINISVETDQYDLLGDQVLSMAIPLIAMGSSFWDEDGAVLLLDEIDRGSNKLLCLQSILEGKPFFNKNTGEIVHPRPGFTWLQQQIPKVGFRRLPYLAQILDDAFLERFPNTVEQCFPPLKTELKIINNEFEKKNRNDPDFAQKLVDWSNGIRKTFTDGGINELISTRRLVDVVRSYLIYDDKQKAIQLCINRFDDETKSQFLEFYKKIDATILEKVEDTAESVANLWSQDVDQLLFLIHIMHEWAQNEINKALGIPSFFLGS